MKVSGAKLLQRPFACIGDRHTMKSDVRGLKCLLSAFCLMISSNQLAAQEGFRESKCERGDDDSSFYSITLKANEGRLKRLTFSNSGDGNLIYRSASQKHLTWTRYLSEFEVLTYHIVDQDFGNLSASLKNREIIYDFGLITRTCWYGLREHMDGLVQTREEVQE